MLFNAQILILFVLLISWGYLYLHSVNEKAEGGI